MFTRDGTAGRRCDHAPDGRGDPAADVVGWLGPVGRRLGARRRAGRFGAGGRRAGGRGGAGWRRSARRARNMSCAPCTRPQRARRRGGAAAWTPPAGSTAPCATIIRAMLASPVPVLGLGRARRGARRQRRHLHPVCQRPGRDGARHQSRRRHAGLAVRRHAAAGSRPASTRRTARRPAEAPDAELVKITNDAVAYIRGLATLHGRNADWAEKAVREAVSLSYDAALRSSMSSICMADASPHLLAAADGRTGDRRRQAQCSSTPPVLDDPRGRAEPARPPLGVLTDPSIVYLLLLAGPFGHRLRAVASRHLRCPA